MSSSIKENYLKSLYVLSTQKDAVNVTELSSFLGVRLPTVNSMVKKLKRQGLVDHERYKPISLTGKGKKEAALIIRKHRLTEMFLVNKMGFGWEEVHDIAEQIEHISSSIFFERMDELLGYPKFDPHGSPIPDVNGDISKEFKLQLSSCMQGDNVRVVALSTDASDFVRFLNIRELILGTELTIKSIETFDRSMIVSYKNHVSEILSKVVCDNLLVEYL